ncbi:MAG TPA: sialate:H+ symport family MFS transporter [Pseudonocardiaceae bacterium]|jgi:SHS family sialic acid transporter-like MFS transporter|nr:sialate:H+ symport family MFS transporter [Pseudonocardiaceae bacterium]
MSSAVSAPVPWYRQLDSGQRKAFAAAWIGYLLDGFDFVLITLVLTDVAKEFHLSLTVAAGLVSAAFVSRWLGGLVLGAIGDRFGRRPAMILSILFYALGSALCGLSWGYWSLFIFRAIVGLGMAGEYGSSTTYVMESWPPALRGRASGFLLSAYPIGSILAARVYALVVPSLGWRWLFFIGIIPVVVALWLRRSLPEAKDWTREVGAATTTRATSATALLNRRWAAANVVITIAVAASLVLIFSGHAGSLYPLYIAVSVLGFVAFASQISGRRWPMAVGLMATVFCAFLYSWPIQSLLPTYLKTVLHYDSGQVANALTWAGLGYAVGSCVAGLLGDRFGIRRTYVGGLLVSLVFVFPTFALSGAGGSIVLVWVLLFILQGTGSGISGLLPKYIGDHFPIQLRAAGLGFTYNVGALGGAVAPVVGASIAAHIGLGPALAWLAAGLTLLTALLVGFNVPVRLLGRNRAPAEPELAGIK